MQALYRELPDELPVKRDPVRQALKGLAAAAAVFGAVCAGMFACKRRPAPDRRGAAGVGGVFQALNQPKEEALPRPPGHPDARRRGRAGHGGGRPTAMPWTSGGRRSPRTLRRWRSKARGAPCGWTGPGATGSPWCWTCAWTWGTTASPCTSRPRVWSWSPPTGRSPSTARSWPAGRRSRTTRPRTWCAPTRLSPLPGPGTGPSPAGGVMDLAALGEDATASGECQVTLGHGRTHRPEPAGG